MTTARIFQSGNSQALRLPKAFRFRSNEVEIFRRGDEVVLREHRGSVGDNLAAAAAHAGRLLCGRPPRRARAATKTGNLEATLYYNVTQ